MKHSHHHCECDHSNVKYCKTCKVVHCLECNQEWRTFYNYNYNTYPYWGIYTNDIGQTGALTSKSSNFKSALQGSQNDNTLDDGHTTTCNHQS